MQPFIIDASRTRDLSPEALEAPGRPRVLPASYWAGTTPAERAMFGHRHGIYTFPTVELVEHLRGVIGDRTAIEIGAGNGALAAALGITATDSYQHQRPKYRAIYARAGQPTVTYGPDVVECDADEAVRRYRPQVVISCWVTWKYDPARHHAGGNEVGVDEADIVAHCETYVSIGNDGVHRGKAIWAVPHRIEYPPFVYSRARRGREFVATWGA